MKRRQFIKVTGGTFLGAILLKFLDFFPEAKFALARKEGDAGVEISPLKTDDSRVVELKTLLPGQYNGDAFGGEPDWQQAKLVARHFHGDSSQDSVVVPISTRSEEILCLAVAIHDGDLDEPIVVGTTVEELRPKESFTGTIVAYRLDGSKVISTTIKDNQVILARVSTPGKYGGLAIPVERPLGALCCNSQFWVCMAEGSFSCLICCAWSPPIYAICMGSVTTFCVALYCYFC